MSDVRVTYQTSGFGPSTLEDVPPTEDIMMIPMIRVAILLFVFVHFNAAINTITMAKVNNWMFLNLKIFWNILKY